MKPFLSLVIPARNEEENVLLLYNEIVEVTNKLKKTWELMFIDDGSTDNTFNILKKLHSKDSRVKVLRLRGWFGKAIALKAGFENATGEIIFTLDADLQDNPKEIPNFLKKFEEGYDLVIGWKKKRHDPADRVISSRLFNFAVSVMTQTKFHDINCGFKAYKRVVVENVEFGELFRFIPILAAKQNYKVAEIVVEHRPRKFGESKFGLERAVKGFLDLITIVFLTGYLRKPGQFFGMIGLVMGFGGVLIGAYITYLRITTGGIEYRYPLLFLGVLLMIVGVQFISTGLTSEMMISLSGREKSTKALISEKL